MKSGSVTPPALFLYCLLFQVFVSFLYTFKNYLLCSSENAFTFLKGITLKKRKKFFH